MAERQTGLTSQKRRIDRDAGIVIRENCPAIVAQVDAWPGREQPVQQALTGKDVDIAVRQVHQLANGMFARLTPERFFLVSDAGDLPVLPVLPDDDGSVFDLSHARACLHIAGAPVEQVLAKGAVLDFSVTGFPVGSVAQTMAHHMDLTIIRRSETEFDIYVFRGFAESLLEHLVDAADEFGVSFHPFSPPT